MATHGHDVALILQADRAAVVDVDEVGELVVHVVVG